MMDEYLIKYGRVPKNVNLDRILDGVEGNKTKIKYLKEGMVYLLSLISFDNNSSTEWEDGYRRLTEKILSEIIGQKRPSQITRILKERGVIETIPYSKGHFSIGYRLTEKYNIGEFKKVELSKRIKDKLREHLLSYSKDEINLNTEYNYILSQFKKNKIEFGAGNIDKFIKDLGTVLFYRTIKLSEKTRGFTLKSLFNFVGRMMSIKEDIDKKRFNPKFSPSNHRFHSKIVSLPKILRPFLQINGEEIVEIDISSSQPYILSTILSEDFTCSIKNGYNLHSIYRELFEMMGRVKSVIPTNMKGNDFYRLGIHLSSSSLEGLNKFSNFDFTQDFYNHVLTEGHKLYPKYFNLRKETTIDRDYIKQHIMNFLFERNEYNRENDPVIGLLNEIFPELCRFVERFNEFYGKDKLYGKNEFSYLLQRTESHLMLGNVCQILNNEYRDIPFYTIHDSLLTTKPNSQVVENIITETIFNITGKRLKVKSKDLHPFKKIPPEIVEESWLKVKISSPEKYDKMKYSLLQKNIKNGLSILPLKEQKYWSTIMREETIL